MSWLLHRVDDRLIHGQVVVSWAQHLNPRRIWVVDDAIAANDWERDMLTSSAPDHDVHVHTVSEAAAGHAAESLAKGGAFLLVRDLASALALVQAGAVISLLNLGGLHYASGKDKVNEYIYLDDADRDAARTLLLHGVRLEVQDVPATRARQLAALDPALQAP